MNNDNRCTVRVATPGTMRFHQCTRKSVKDGYCRQHHPDAYKDRAEKGQKRYLERKARNPLYVALRKVEICEGRLNTLLEAAEHILAILQHPTRSVTVLDAAKLEDAVKQAKGGSL